MLLSYCFCSHPYCCYCHPYCFCCYYCCYCHPYCLCCHYCCYWSQTQGSRHNKALSIWLSHPEAIGASGNARNKRNTEDSKGLVKRASSSSSSCSLQFAPSFPPPPPSGSLLSARPRLASALEDAAAAVREGESRSLVLTSRRQTAVWESKTPLSPPPLSQFVSLTPHQG